MDCTRLARLALMMVLVLGTGSAGADVLLIDSMQSAPAVQTPRRGMQMPQVRQNYGEPVTVHPAIGDPPITRWDYGSYSVFFEYDMVLHSVVHRPGSN